MTLRHLLVALALAGGFALASPALPRPAGPIATAHAQLVSSSPGAGEVVATPPTELRLVFSEPLDARSSSLDLLDAGGQPVRRGIGAPDPADPYALVATVTRLPHGTYTVSWRTLSAADGHTASGFFTFSIGHADMPHSAHAGVHAGVHAQHAAGATVAEVQARVLGYVGLMLAFGLSVIAAAVLRPVTGRWPRRVAIGQAIALAAAGLGGILLALVAASDARLDPGAYLTGSRTGQLLLGRVGLAVAGALAVLAFLTWKRTGAAILVAGGVALAGLGLLSLSGHAAGYASPGPTAAIFVHVAAGSIWIGGVVALADLALFGRHRRTPALARLVPRFSALALVSVALLALTGLYSAWLQTRDLTSLASPYSVAAAVKVALFAAALVLGGLNFLDAGRRSAWLGGFGRRVAVESALGIAVLVATGNMATGSPPAQEQPITIAPAVSAAALESDQGARLRFAVQPGRPGPNRYRVDLPATPPPGTALELER